MYEDLIARRAQVAKDASGGDAESLARAAESQKDISGNQTL
jgi:hypothetical protein